MTYTPRSSRICSASAVVGPLAASARIFVRMRGAFSAVSWFSSAAGIRMSHSSSSSRWVGVRFFAPGKFRIDPVAFGQRDDHAAGLLAEARRVIPDVAKALHDHALALEPALEAEPLHVVDVAARFAQAVVHATPGGLHAAADAALRDGLPGHARELVDG